MSNKTCSFAQGAELKTKWALTDEEKLILVAKVSADAIYDWDMVAGLTRWNHGLYSPGTRWGMMKLPTSTFIRALNWAIY